MNKIENENDLLEMVADSMNCSIAYWQSIKDVIEKNIIISRTVCTRSYITESEYLKLSQKKWIGK